MASPDMPPSDGPPGRAMQGSLGEFVVARRGRSGRFYRPHRDENGTTGGSDPPHGPRRPAHGPRAERAPTPDGPRVSSDHVGGAGDTEIHPTEKMGPEIYADIGTNIGECAEGLGRGTGEVCSPPEVVSAISEFVEQRGDRDRIGSGDRPQGRSRVRQSRIRRPSSSADVLPDPDAPGGDVIREAAALLGCSSESCVVIHPDLRRHLAGYAGERAAEGGLEGTLARIFKTSGPRESRALLSNFNIDSVLQRWAGTFENFYNYGFAMMDFDTAGGSLAVISPADILDGSAPQLVGAPPRMVRRPCTVFGCVLNTDVSTGRGKHWVAVFGDCRGRKDKPWTVEYFNSTGNPPPRSVARWMEDTAGSLAAYRNRRANLGSGGIYPVAVTNVRHQEKDTECGLYALFYIRKRLEGEFFEYFRGAKIPDATMAEFRRHVFRSGR